MVYNQPERDSLANSKKCAITATYNIDSCFCHAKNNGGVVTILDSNSPEIDKSNYL